MDGSRKLHVLLAILYVKTIMAKGSVVIKEKPCPELSPPEHGSINTIDFDLSEVTTTVTFSCDSGYVLQGASSTACQRDGKWTESLPSCKKRCPKLSAPEHGSIKTINFDFTEVLTTVTFSCESGYVLQGASSTACQRDGEWTESVPSCRQCQQNWRHFGNFCYYFNHTARISYSEAEAECQDMDANLTSIHNQEEQNFIAGHVINSDPSNNWFAYWMGGNDLDVEGRFVWIDETSFQFTNWHPAEPFNFIGPSGDDQDCIGILPRDGKWSDQFCTKRQPFVCKKTDTV